MKKNLIFIILFFLSTNLFAEKKGMMLENLTSQEKTYNNVQDLNNLGVNIVRLPFYSDKTADEYASQLFNLATKFKHITIVSDFHWTNLNLCKNSTTDRISNNIEIILDRTCRDSFFNFWEIVSKKTGHLKNIWFDLLNEPNPKMNWKKWQPIFIKAAKIIRKNSKNKIVVPITGAGCRRLKNFGKLPKISNQILTCHFYNFGNWHYDNSDYPKNAKNKIKEVLLDFKNKYKIFMLAKPLHTMLILMLINI